MHIQNDHGVEDASLRVNLWGREFPNPVGLAAGFDKHAQVRYGKKERRRKEEAII